MKWMLFLKSYQFQLKSVHAVIFQGTYKSAGQYFKRHTALPSNAAVWFQMNQKEELIFQRNIPLRDNSKEEMYNALQRETLICAAICCCLMKLVLEEQSIKAMS